MLKAWMDVAFDSALLCAEAGEVMGLRLLKLASGGGDAGREVVRMMAEKSVVFADAGCELAAGAPLALVVRRYRALVRANKLRLSR